jgi:hypothetical protein
MGCNWLPLEHDRVLDPGDDEIPELLRLPVKGADMPAQAVVDQRKGDDFPLSTAARY